MNPKGTFRVGEEIYINIPGDADHGKPGKVTEINRANLDYPYLAKVEGKGLARFKHGELSLFPAPALYEIYVQARTNFSNLGQRDKGASIMSRFEMIKISLGRNRNLIIMPGLSNWRLSCALGLLQIGPFVYEYPS